MASFRTLDDIDPDGRRVVVRADLNVPVRDGKVGDPTRIERAADTIRALLDKGAAVLVLMALAFVVSVCSNVDAFFILSFAATFSPGGIVAFLVFGAMVDIKMLALLRTTFTSRALALIAGLVGLCALVLGMGMNLAL